jgi:hypothetical protein
MRKTIITSLLVAAPRAAFACPVCFGQNDSPLAKGVNMGIFMMLGFVALVLASFAYFFIYLIRRAKIADRASAAGAGSRDAAAPLASTRHVSTPQEGTA